MFFVALISKFAFSLLMVDAVLVYPFHYCLEVLDIVVWIKVFVVRFGHLWDNFGVEGVLSSSAEVTSS